MKSYKLITLVLFLQAIIATILFAIFITNYKPLNKNDFVFGIVASIYAVLIFPILFLLLSDITKQKETTITTVTTFGEKSDSSTFEKIGKIFIAESIITGIAKKEFIDKNISELKQISNFSKDEVYEIYGNIHNLHADYYKAIPASKKIGFKN
jgi:hypothetical protein